MAPDPRRLELQTELEFQLGSANVYFQPPGDLRMQYPCIVYKRDDLDTKFAGNSPYSQTKRYSITVIDRDPDSNIPDRIGKLPLCEYNRFYTAEGLNHDVFNLFF